MTRPIVASSMLRTAYKLAGQQAGPGRPALCDLRRATSTAYYALFHQITRHGAFAVVPEAEEAEVAHMTRWHTHTGVREAARFVIVAAGSDSPRRPDLSAVSILRRSGRGVPAELSRIAQIFVKLQDARHEADYSNDYDPVRYVTLRHVEMADQALRTVWTLWRAQWAERDRRKELHDAYRRFLHVALLSSGGPRTRG